MTKEEKLVACPDGCANIDSKCGSCIEGSEFIDVLAEEKEILLKQVISLVVDENKRRIMDFLSDSDKAVNFGDTAVSLKLDPALFGYHLNGNKNNPFGLVKLGLVEKLFTNKKSFTLLLTKLGEEVLEWLKK